MNTINPFSSKRKVAARPGIAMGTTGRVRDGRIIASANEPTFNSAGEINAGSKKEVAQIIQANLIANQNPEMVSNASRGRAEELFASLERQKVLASTASDNEVNDFLRNSASNEQLGKIVADTIDQTLTETMGRQAFSRNILNVVPANAGSIARIRIPQRDGVVAYNHATNQRIVPAEIRDRHIYPQMFNVSAAANINEMEMAASGANLLDEAYGLISEQMWRDEDLYLRDLANAAAAVRNRVLTYNRLSPTVFQSLRRSISDYSLVPVQALIANDLWDDLIVGSEFSAHWDPVTRYEMIRDGQIGSLYNVAIRTDGFRHRALKVLNPGECYIFSSMDAVGTIFEWQPMRTVATNGYNNQEAKRGWFSTKIMSMTVLSNGVARGYRA